MVNAKQKSLFMIWFNKYSSLDMVYYYSQAMILLNTAGVKHNSNPASNTLRVQVPRKLAPNNTIASMAPANLSPVHSKLASVLSFGAFSNVSNTLSEVELSIFLWVTAFDFDKGGVVVLVAEATLVSEDGARKVEANWLGVLLGHDSDGRWILMMRE